MAIQGKTRRSTARRRTAVLPARIRTAVKPRRTLHLAKSARFAHHKVAHHGPSQYTKALRFLNTLSDFERLRIVRYTSQNFDLDRMRTLLRKLGNPQDQYRSVHVAGTKGKGSTCVMIASMLRACGYKVGLYTSPHLVDIRERIQVNGQMISSADFARIVRQAELISNRMKPGPTYFDVLTAVGFKYF